MDKNRIVEQRVEQLDPGTDPTRHHDNLTGFGDRSKLIGDLTDALEPGRAPSTLSTRSRLARRYSICAFNQASPSRQAASAAT